MKSEYYPGMTAKFYPLSVSPSSLESPLSGSLTLEPEGLSGGRPTPQGSVEVTAGASSEVAESTSQATGFQGSAWKVFGTTFVTIFLAELGDKTQVSTLLMSAESHQPWTIFAGAASALVATSLVGVWVGWWLSARISPRVLDRAAGITLAMLSVWLFWEVLG